MMNNRSKPSIPTIESNSDIQLYKTAKLENHPRLQDLRVDSPFPSVQLALPEAPGTIHSSTFSRAKMKSTSISLEYFIEQPRYDRIVLQGTNAF
jgi:hypothetical protein